jgi:predicted subunit of tRNA(5-methylaminomethyl-2-thiouridylate) methyltransferase
MSLFIQRRVELDDGDSPDPETAIFYLHTQCLMQELIAETDLKRIGHGTFVRTDKVPPKSMRPDSARN